MQKISLKKYLVLGLMLACFISALLSGCGKKEWRWAGDKSAMQRLSIGEELQWKSTFDWLYFPQNDSEDGRRIGYFKQINDLRKKMLATTPKSSRTLSTPADESTIEIYHNMLSEEDLFALINSQAKELTEKYPEYEVIYRINGSTETDQFVQLDAAKEHQLYIRMKDSVYILYGEMPYIEWQNFLKKWLFSFDLQWNNLMVMKEDGVISNTYAEYKREGLWKMFQYGEDSLRIDGNPLLFHKQENGFYFEIESENAEEKLVEEVILRPTDIYLKYGDWEEAVSYFTDRYPNMQSLDVYIYGEDTLWDSEHRILDWIFYQIEEPEGTHGFLLQKGKTCEVFSQGKRDYYNMVDAVRSSMGYDYDACFSWMQAENVITMYEDNLEEKYSYVKNLGNGKVIRLQAEINGKTAGEFLDTYTYKVEIFDKAGNKLLQEIQAESTYIHESPIKFEDFNADGYLDLTVRYYYGANGGSASHYIYSPSKEKFVQLDSELDYYGMYSVDYETRRLYMHYHGSAIDGTETAYQWKNEMDYEMIKQFDHDAQDDHVLVKIVRYDNGKEEILSDYLYPSEEYLERPDIWGTYYEDFIWEKEVTDHSTGKKYMIRYAEVFLPEEAEKNNGIYYDGRIYIYDEDTYLIGVTHSEIVAKSDSISWADGGETLESAVVINYVDGGKSTFHLAGLIIPDYQSDR